MSINTGPQEAPNSANWQNGLKAALRGPWGNVALIAGLAIVLGLLLPKFLPNDTVIDNKDRPRADAKGLATDGKSPATDVKVGSEYKAPTLADAPNPHVLLSRLFMGTIAVLGLSVVSIWMMRRWLQGQGPANSAQRDMRLIETLHFGNRTSLHLVHLGKREILVGTDAGGIKSIVPLARPFDDALADAEVTNAAAETVPVIVGQQLNAA